MMLREFIRLVLPDATGLDKYTFSDTQAVFIGSGYLNVWLNRPRCQFCGAPYMPRKGAIPSQTCKHCRDEIREGLKQKVGDAR